MAATGNEIIYVDGDQITLNDLVTMVYDILSQRSTDVGQFPVASSMTGINSLPALRMAGNTAEVVTVAISLLKGADGKQVEMRLTSGEGAALQWRLTDGEWSNLITVAQIQQPAIEAATSLDEYLLSKEELFTQLQQDTISAKDAANEAAISALDTANHPTFIGADHYVYIWNKETRSYDKTDIFVKGEAFDIKKVYPSVEAMFADIDNPDIGEGDFVLINTNDVEIEENAQIYVKAKTANGDFTWQFLIDMSGAIGFTGKTPQITVGTVSKTAPGGAPSAALEPDGTDEGGNPKFRLNLVFPTGDTGPVPIIETGTTTTGAPGTQASASLVENGFTAEGVRKYLLNLILPEGMPGDGSGNVYVSVSNLLASKLYLFQPNLDGSAVGSFIEYTLPVLFSGDYNDLTNRPYIVPVTIDHIPGENDTTYTEGESERSFPIGAETRYYDAEQNKYIFYKLHAIVNGKAVWQLSGRIYGADDTGGLELTAQDQFRIKEEYLGRLKAPEPDFVDIAIDDWTQPEEDGLWQYTLTDPKLTYKAFLEYWPDRSSQYIYTEANVYTDPDVGTDEETGAPYIVIYAEKQPKDRIRLKYIIEYKG